MMDEKNLKTIYTYLMYYKFLKVKINFIDIISQIKLTTCFYQPKKKKKKKKLTT